MSFLNGSGQSTGLSNSDLLAKAKELGLQTLKGVFSKDTLPTLHDNECAIVNIENSHDENGNPLPGTHWVAVGIRNHQSWYFDSFGLDIPPLIKKAVPKPIYHSSQEFQSPHSTLCGLFALAACVAAEQTDHIVKNLDDFTRQFDRPDMNGNDRQVKQYLSHHQHHKSKSGLVYDNTNPQDARY